MEEEDRMKAKIKQQLFLGEIVRKEKDEYKVVLVYYVLNDRYNSRIEKRKWKDGYIYELESLTNKQIIRVVGFYCMKNRKRTKLLGDIINYEVIQTVEERIWKL